MPDAPAKIPKPRKDVTGEFLDLETGRSHAYVARFRRVATDVIWSARVRLSGRWVVLQGGRVAHAGAERDDFVVSEMVRDSVLDTLTGADMDQALEAAKRAPAWAAAARWAVGGLVLCLLAFGIRAAWAAWGA